MDTTKENIMLYLFDNVVTSFIKKDNDKLFENVRAFKASLDQQQARKWGRTFSSELDKHINVYSANYDFDSRCEEVAYLSHYLHDAAK